VKEKLVPSAWLEKEGRRLDCGPYLSGAVEAKVLLEKLPVHKQLLQKVTAGGMGGIFHAGRHGRTYVTSSDHGHPFLSSSEVLLADFAYVDCISKRQADATPEFILGKDWTLITRSGTIGRMAYSRPDMAGLACSEHVLRVVPDSDKAAPGYLFAFLSGRFGVPLVVGGTYGSIIQSIEPQHVADLPVPIAPKRIQEAAHALVIEAADLRTKASAELKAVIQAIENAAGLPAIDRRYGGASPDVSVVPAGTLKGRMDGLFHSSYHRSALSPLMGLPPTRRTTVRDLSTRVFEPARFKRVSVEDLAYGVPFFGTSALMRADPDASYLLAKRTPGIDELTVTKTTLLIPRSGQLVGLIGHAVLPHGDVLGGAVSEDAIRVVAPDEGTAGYLYACLSSEYGRRQLKARAFGSSIPHLDVRVIGDIVVPQLDDPAMKKFGTRAFAVASARHEALRKEREARALVERWIETKGGA
jgi:type I restriction enzyme, S subunit